MNMTVVISLLGLVGLFLALYGLWQSLMVDITRQHLFQIRDEIFDKAADGAIAFDSPVYKGTRDMLNGMIRHCHDFTWLEFISMALLARRPAIKPALPTLIDQLEDKALSDFLKAKMRDAGIYMLALAWLRSPLLLAVTAILMPLIAVIALLKSKNSSTDMDIISKLGTKIEQETLLTESIAA